MYFFPIFGRPNIKIRASHIGIWLLSVTLTLSSWLPTLAASQIDIVGPFGSEAFGQNITLLANGNFVVADPGYDMPNGPSDVGAVYLYNGATATLISTLTGSSANDAVGSNGVTVLANGNYVVVSSQWGTNGAINVGAVTWGNATSGVDGVVNSSNSLIGNNNGDQIGSNGVTVLDNGNYVVVSPDCDMGAADRAGCVTWGNGNTGIQGTVSGSNSLVGNRSGSLVGSGGVKQLGNSNYLVMSPLWFGSFTPGLGAVTWGDGNTGINGVVSSSNSLVGSTKDDRVGFYEPQLLANGNYVVRTPDWDRGVIIDAGAVTWGDGTKGIKGEININNSLIGSKSGDQVGSGVIRIVGNSNYVVSSPFWNNDVGAVTWGNGSTGISGVVNSSNSLVGSVGSVGNIVGSQVGSGGVIVLSNGNYVVSSPLFDFLEGIKDIGAVTWGNGDTGINGVVSDSNSLLGLLNDDRVGSDGVTALTNGNYVVSSPFCDTFSAKDASLVHDVGAATWGNGSTGISGVVNSSNSLVGSSTGDRVGDNSARSLSNGNYVVLSPNWNNGAALAAGAATWGNGSTGISGAVNSSNSLVGSRINDHVGDNAVRLLSNGNYVVISPYWDGEFGAVTWGNGVTGISGPVTSDNSLIGDMPGDKIGFLGLTLLGNDNFLVHSPDWDNGSIIDAGAVTWVNGASGISGVVNSSNSLVGSQNDEQVGLGEVIALRNDNYIVPSQFVDNGSIVDAGAVTWGNGITGISGAVNSSNSLVGSSKDDRVGFSAMALSDGNYVVFNQQWNNGNLSKAGAITLGDGRTGVIGAVNSNNSVLGKVADGGPFMRFAEDVVNKQIIVGRSAENIITLFRLTPAEIEVTGKNIAIVDGDASPVSTDGTDLGTRVVGSGALSQNFTISNTGDVDLTIDAITLSGAQASDFSISGASLPKVLASNTNFTFTLNFTPSATGLRIATVNIANDDSDENPYTFAVQGTGTQHKLTTTKAGNGTGSITLSPAGGNYNHNTVVTVTAKADAGSIFAGWSGACSGTGACSVTMTSAKSVTATFNKSGDSSQKVYLPLITK